MSVNRIKPRGGFTLIELMLVIALIAMLAAILVPNFLRVRSRSQLTGCKQNCKTIATALELYSAENSTKFPTNLTLLTPKYLKTMATCPATGSDTYSASYTPVANPERYTFFCQGANHTSIDVSGDFPLWSSEQGLREQ